MSDEEKIPILLVDDRPENLLALEGLLAELNLNMILAESGNEALRQSLKRDFSLVLLDVQMPGMDGFETAELMRANPKTRHIPIIFITAGAKETIHQFKGYEAGAVDFLFKPIETGILQSKVRIFCELYRQRRSIERHERELELMVRKRTRELHESEEQLRAAQEIAHVGSWTGNPETGETRWSNELFRIFGLIPEKTAPSYAGHQRFIHPEDWPEFDAANRKALSEGEGYDLELRIIRPDATERNVLCRVRPRRDPETGSTMLCGAMQDVTDRVFMETQLRQAQKMEAIGTLAGGIAHDFNNLLAAILGYTELSLDSVPPDSNLHHFLMQIIKAGYRARDLIKQILSFSRQSIQKKQPVCFSVIVKEAMKLLRASVPATIEFHTTISPEAEAATVQADPTALHQILMNLCTNAAHAMQKNGGLLDVHLVTITLDDEFIARHPELTPGSYLQLSITDTGHGMTEEVKRHIFEPYFTTKKFGEGTGLGLAAVYGIVKDCRGITTFESEVGKGTVFHVFLPRLEDVAVPVRAESSDKLPRGHGRILVVDDEEMLVETEKAMLTELGYEVTAYTSSTEALLAFKENPHLFDMVMTDLSMPRMSGSELSREILAVRPDIPIVICTGYSETMDREKATALGVRKFFMKPLIMEELAKMVSELLGGNK